METVAAFRSSINAIQKKYPSHVDISGFGSKFVFFDASRSHRSCGRSSAAASVAPLKFESPIGQFLSEMLKNHSYLVHAAVEQQLEQLQTDCNAENDDRKPLLHRRIAKVKASERCKALEDILYTIVVQKFNDANAPLASNIIPSTLNCGRVETWPNNDQSKLVQLHSLESYEMIKNHLSHILGDTDSNTIAEINKAKIGQVYAASAIYGYFLRRVDQRYQMKNMTNSIGHDDDFSRQDDSAGVITSRLKNYVTLFDKETLQRYAKIRSKEAVSIIEKHTAALFGRAKVAVTPQGSSDSSKDCM